MSSGSFLQANLIRVERLPSSMRPRRYLTLSLVFPVSSFIVLFSAALATSLVL